MKTRDKGAQDEYLLNCTETRIVYTQAYEISTRVGAEVDSKGNIKPNAQVSISRKLDTGDEIKDLVHADISRGVEEVMIAIEDILKRGAQ